MKPMNGFVLIKADETTQTKSGILVTKGALRLPQTGVITAISPTSSLKIGDRVQFLRYACIDTDDPRVKICKEIHIVGVIDA